MVEPTGQTQRGRAYQIFGKTVYEGATGVSLDPTNRAVGFVTDEKCFWTANLWFWKLCINGAQVSNGLGLGAWKDVHLAGVRD